MDQLLFAYDKIPLGKQRSKENMTLDEAGAHHSSTIVKPSSLSQNHHFLLIHHENSTLKRRRFDISGRLTFGSGWFENSVNRLTDRLLNRPHFGKKILFRLPNRILSVKSVGGQFRFGRCL
jgi:hypothetical protein